MLQKYFENNSFDAVFINEDNFIKDIQSLLTDNKINSQFSLADLDVEKVKRFLKNK